MSSSRLSLNLDELNVDSFRTSSADESAVESVIIYTVLPHTGGVSCGGTCGTCGGTDCWAVVDPNNN
ncbi:MAG TPA: hypothetical protein VGC13_27605 [Longimicrobium sp.]|jgi:ArsR family metal-binding transcriptional regulator|uniref:hypothetical protein n=1 Tax=Longimicrobium sp. TaxID=2029185 RepID=UPI002ED7FF81